MILTYGVDPHFPKLFKRRTIVGNTHELMKVFIYSFIYHYPHHNASKLYDFLEKYVGRQLFEIINSSIIDIINCAPENAIEVSVGDFLDPSQAKYFFRGDINPKGEEKMFVSIKINNSKEENYRVGYYFDKKGKLQLRFIDFRRRNLYDGSYSSKPLIKEIIKAILTPPPIKNKYSGFRIWKFPDE